MLDVLSFLTRSFTLQESGSDHTFLFFVTDRKVSILKMKKKENYSQTYVSQGVMDLNVTASFMHAITFESLISQKWLIPRIGTPKWISIEAVLSVRAIRLRENFFC